MSSTIKSVKTNLLADYSLPYSWEAAPAEREIEIGFVWKALQQPWETFLTFNHRQSAFSGISSLVVTGTADSEWLIGSSADDTLDGGAGADTMVGSIGNDTYYVDSAGDVVGENTDQGADLVIAAVDYTLSKNVENLTLIGDALIGTGNSLDNVIIGNAHNNTLGGGTGNDTLIGAAGDDVYYISPFENLEFEDIVIESANEGIDTVYLDAAVYYGRYTLTANVENLVMLNGGSEYTYNELYGNELDNKITGNNQANRIKGGLGADTMSGGGSDDVYYVADAGDVVIEHADEGEDDVFSTIDYTLTAHVEHLTLQGTAISGTGNDLDNRIIDNEYANVIRGEAGNDTLWGGYSGQSGADTLIGGSGNDKYVIDSADDVVIEYDGEGIDIVSVNASNVDYTLGDTLENLFILSGVGTGNKLDNYIEGMGTLIGNEGNDTLEGGRTMIGGAGDDVFYSHPRSAMSGGIGNDAYWIDSVDTTITEAADEGHDEIFVTYWRWWEYPLGYALGDNVEDLHITSGTPRGTGNNLDNHLSVFDDSGSDNILDGGLGADTLEASRGNDTYYVDNAGDVVIEALDEGHDTIIATVSYALSANVEDLTLAGTAIAGTGNNLDNYLTGNASNNNLSGGAGNDTIDGGLGNDTMVGGTGDDTYYVNSVSDRVTELAGGGTDTVFSSASYTLSSNVEKLVLTGSAIRGTGNTLDNTVQGNAGGNILNGGSGSDTLTGGAGVDQFEFNSAHIGFDTVTDFASGEDQIVLSGFGLDELQEGYNLMIDSEAVGEYATLLYNSTTGVLFFDEDGTGAISAKQIVILSNKPMLTAVDFLLI